MAETTTDKASPSATPASSPTQGEAARAATESTAAEALAPQRLGALERPNLPPAEPRRDIPDALTNLHSGSRTDPVTAGQEAVNPQAVAADTLRSGGAGTTAAQAVSATTGPGSARPWTAAGDGVQTAPVAETQQVAGGPSAIASDSGAPSADATAAVPSAIPIATPVAAMPGIIGAKQESLAQTVNPGEATASAPAGNGSGNEVAAAGTSALTAAMQSMTNPVMANSVMANQDRTTAPTTATTNQAGGDATGTDTAGTNTAGTVTSSTDTGTGSMVTPPAESTAGPGSTPATPTTTTTTPSTPSPTEGPTTDAPAPTGTEDRTGGEAGNGADGGATDGSAPAPIGSGPTGGGSSGSGSSGTDPASVAPTLEITAGSGAEDSPLALTIGLSAGPAGSTTAVTIDGLPPGASLSAGVDLGNGRWSLSPADLPGLMLLPPPDYAGTIVLTVTAVSTDGSGRQATSSGMLSVTVTPQADAPTLTLTGATGGEDQPVALTIATAMVTPAAGEVLSVVIGGVPAGATLSAGTANGDGTWTLSPAQLAGLTLTPPSDFSGTIALTVTATSSVNGTQASRTGTLTVAVAPEAHAPNLSVASATGTEDQPVALTLSAGLVNAAHGEVLAIVIGGVPTGSTLSAGIDNGDGSWTLTSAQLAGLTLTPPANFAGTLNLTVTATSTVNGTQASRSETLTVSVTAVADAPDLSVAGAAGTSGQPIALTLSSSLVSPAAGEVLTVVIGSVPAGAALSAGTDNGDGTWTLSAGQLAGLTLTPPTNFSGTLALTVTAISSLDGTEVSRSGTLTVSVAPPAADEPALAVSNATGTEDHAIALTIATSLATPMAGEVLSVTVSGLPFGATLSAGTQNGDGTWTLTPAQLAGLTLTPPADFSGSLALTVTATSSLNGTQASKTETLTITVAPEADVPSLSVTAATGAEDQPVALTVASSLTDPAAGEALSVVIAGVPTGAMLSAGIDNGDGTWTLTPAQLTGLTLTPPADFSGTLNLTVTATASVNGTQASQTLTLTVTVAPEADAPNLSVTNVTGIEDHAVALTIGAALVSPVMGEALSVVIAGIPAGATLSSGTDNGDGTWTLTSAQLSGLTLTPPVDFSGTLNLTVTATSTVGGTQAGRTEILTVTVTPEADAPNLTVVDTTGGEDHAIALTLSSSLVSPAAGETLSVVIGGVPAGATLSAGTDNGDGSWTVSPAQLTSLTLTPPADFSGTVVLTVTATSFLNGTQASKTETLTVTVAPEADAPNLSISNITGSEDQPITLNLSSSLTNPAAGETLGIVVAGVPTGAMLSAGIDNGDGTWTLTPAQLTGLTLTPPADFSGTLNLTVTATASVNGTQASQTLTLTVTVAPEADAPSLSVASAVGIEDHAIALTITNSLTTPAVGEVLHVVIAGVPAGAMLSAGTDNGDGTWTLSAAQLAGLTLTPPADFSGTLNLTVTATASVNGTQASQTETLTVTVTPEADAPTLAVLDTAGLEDHAVSLVLSCSLLAPAAGEVLHVVIVGVPTGAALSAGTDNGDGTWTLSAAQLAGLTLTPPADFSGSLALTVTATSSVNGTQASRTGALTVTVDPEADAPNLSVAGATGTEDQPITLNIASSLTNPAAGEVLSVVIANVPAGAMLSTGTDNGDGTWTLSAAQLAGLTLTPPTDFSGTLALTVTATSSVNGTQAGRTETLTLTVTPEADAPSLSVANATVVEDHAVALTIGAALVSPVMDEALSVVIAGIPAGATLSSGSDNGDGTWTLSAAQLTGLTLTPPTDFSGTISLTVTATSTVSGTQASRTEALTVTVTPEADAPSLSVANVVGREDHPVALNLSAALTSPAAGEVLGIVVSGIPNGATLSSGTNNGDGTWTLSPGQLAGLTLTPPTDFSGTISLTVTATSTVSGTQASQTQTLTVTVTPEADAPSLSVTNATGVEDHAVALTVSSSLPDPAAGEVLSIVIAGIPAGATLSAGSDNGDGTWTLSPTQFAGLTLTPPADFFGTLNLTVTATSSVNGTQASRTETLTVTVAPEADAPNLSISDVTGAEDQPIALTITGSLTNPAADEVLNVVIAGIPAGATLSAGTDNGDGTWTLSPTQLSGLTLTPPADFSGTLALTVTATASINGTQASRTEALTVTVAAEADAPSLSVTDAAGIEDHAIALTIVNSLTVPAGGEVLSIVIGGVPAGAMLSAGIDNGDGTWTLSAAQLTGLTLTPPADFSGTLALTVIATASVNGTQASQTQTLRVTVTPEADAPSLAVADAFGIEDHAVALTLSSSLTNPAAGEVLSVVIAGVPTGATLSAGIDNGDGTWTLTPAQLTGLALTPPADFSGTLALTVTATASINGTQASRTEALTVTVAAEADAPSLSVTNATGIEDHAVALTLSSSLTNPTAGEVLSIVIAGIPAGALLSAGTDNGDGTWTLSAVQLPGLTLTPPADFSGTLALTVTATASVNGTQASRTETLTVTVTPEADAPSLTVADAFGTEDQPVTLTIAGSLIHPAAGELLDIVIAGVPAGATLSAGTDNGDGTWTLSTAQLAGLTLTPPADFSGSLTLAVTATSAVDGTQASRTETLTVSIAPKAAVAETPLLNLADASGGEDHAVALTIAASLATPMPGEMLSIVVSGIPNGATLSAGTDHGDGTWTLTSAQLAGLTLTPPANFSGSLNLTVTATASVNGTQASQTQTLTVTVTPEADAPSLSATNVAGVEDHAIALTLSSSLVSPAAGEVLSVLISGVPTGSTLSAGTDNGDGTWTLSPAQLTGLTLTPPANVSGTIALTVTAISSVNGTQASRTQALTVTVTPEADAPSLSVTNAAGIEDHAIALTIVNSLTVPAGGEVLSIVIAGVPAGAMLSAGIDNGDGTWTLSAAQLTGLTLTPPADFSGTLALTVTATASVNGTQASRTETLTVTVTPEADAPSLAVADAFGTEDQPVALTIAGSLIHPAAGEVLDIVIAGVPAGATLSAGTDNGDGTWTLSTAQLAGLTLTPPADFSGSLTLAVTATSAVDGTQASRTETLTISIAPEAAVAETPLLNLADASGSEDHAVALTIAASLATPMPGEMLSIVVSGIPNGATLSAGSDNGDGTWTLSPAQLAGLTLTPPADFFGTLSLTVTATSTVNGTQASRTEALTVTVTPEADAPNLSVTNVAGVEDHAIALTIAGSLTSPAAGEVLSVVIAGLPTDATLSAGTDNGNGTWTLSPAQLAGLTLTPPTDFSGTLNLTVTATASVNGTQASSSKLLAVTVTPEADAPNLTVVDATGVEDHAIALTLSGSLIHPAVGEVLAVVISGVPSGAMLSAGTNNGDGTWTLSPAQFTGLTLTPPANVSGMIALTVTATSSVNGTQASRTEALTITVTPEADAPSLSVANAVGREDHPVALTLSAALTSPAAGEVLGIVVSGVPSGAMLSSGTNNGDGTWTLSPGQLAGLTLTPPTDFSGTISLTVTAIASVNGTQASQTQTLTVTVTPEADAPSLSVVNATGIEDHAIALTLSSSLPHPAPGEVLSIVVSGIPNGATLSAGTDHGNGTWTLTSAQLAGLTLTPPANFSGTLNLAVTATASVNGTQASRTEALTVTVAPEADTPSLALLPAYGREDQPIGLTIAAHLADIDGSETLGVIVSGVPAGATLSAGTANGNGSWTLTAAQLSGLTLTPPKDFSGSFTLSVTARSTETGAAGPGASASTSLSLPVTVTGVADTPLLTASASSGAADSAIPLHLSALSQDIDNSETVSVRISGIPAGARLSHGVLTGSAGGFTVWTVVADQLSDLTITPPCHYTGVMDLTVRAVATEADGDSTASTAIHVPVTVTASGGGISAGVALNLGVVAGVEDTPVALNLLGGLTALLGSATIDSVVVTGVGNATLSAGVKLADGSYLLTPAQLAGLALIPPHDLSGSYSLSATVTLGGSQLGASVSATLGVQVAGVADAPTLSVSGSAGAYASAIPLTIAGALTDTSGTEHLHYVIGVATGAHLSAGIDNGDGTWTVLPSQLSGLTVTPPYGFSGSLPVTVTAVSQEANGAVASVQKALTVSVAAPSATLLATLASQVAVTGTEDVGINIGQTLLSLNLGSIATVALTGIPSGATLTSGGVAVSAGSISASLLSGLTLTMPANYSGDFQLGATVKLVGGLITLNKTLAVHVAPVADLPTLTVGATISGTEDQPVPLGISGSLLDLDGSESLSFTVAGVPAGVRLSAGHVNPLTGNWILTAAELSGLALLPPPDFSGTISLTVGAVASELLGAVGVTVKPVTITIAPVTDTPILALPAAVGAEDSPIALTIGAAAGDIDGSETITGLQISGLPAGATLNHGTALGNGTYALTKADLVGLTMTPPANYAGTLSLTVTATAKDGTAAPASASGSLSVTVKPVADAPLLTVADCNGRQGHDIALGIGAALVDTDGSEVLSVTIAGLPAGASLSAGLNNGDGSWTLTAAQLAGLKLHTAAGVSGDLHLTVTAHALDGGIGPCNQSLAETSAALTVHIQPEIVPPALSLPDLTVVEHGSALLDLGVGLAGIGLAADVSLTVAGLPVGASLSAGIHNQDGSWTLHADQLLGLRLTPPADSLDDFTLTVTASATVAGLAAVQASGSLHVTVLPDLGSGLDIDAGVAIAPSLSLSVLGTQLVAGATISLDAGFHDGDLLSLGGLRTETDASGNLVIAGTGIQVDGGGYDAAAHTLTLSGTASASVYETVLRAIRLDPSGDCGSRSVAVDLFDGAGHTIDLAHQAIALDVGLDGSVTSKLLSGTASLLDHSLDGLTGALGGLSFDADLLAGLSTGDGTATLLDDPLHHNNANNVYV